MNYRWDKKYLYWSVAAICVIVGGMLFYTLLTNMSGVLEAVGNVIGLFTPVIYGFIFAYLLAPVMNFFEKRCFRTLFTRLEKKRLARGKTRTPEEAKNTELFIKKSARALGLVTTILAALAFLVGLVSAILPQTLSSVVTVIDNTNAYVRNIQGWDLGFLDSYPELQSGVYDFLQNAPAITSRWFEENILPQINEIVLSVTGGIWATLSALLNILIGLVFCIYLLHGKELFAAQGKKALYSLLSLEKANVIIRNMREIHKKFGGFITGKIIDSVIIGALCFVIMTIFRLPYVALISVIIGITNFIPFFGPIIGAIPCALLILVVDPMQCLIFIIIVIALQQFDGNVLGPKILGDTTGLSSFWVLFAIIVGNRLFGFVGLVIGVPLFSFIYALTKGRLAAKLDKKELPADSNFYRNVSHIEDQSGEIIFFSEEKVKKEKKSKKSGFFKKK
ncbi:MAG: AI-2E family transporter [Oscillospiraceae bacterium]|nr:AI-2E family transporter [Oscillospiraceae bacterium]